MKWAALSPLASTSAWAASLRSPSASSRTFYVDSITGNDRQDGLTEATAWKSLAAVNRFRFGPGDTILFRRSGRYPGQLKPQGSGQPGAPIVVDAFGRGEKPHIAAEGRFKEALLLENQEHWEINNLQLTNTGPERAEYRYGVRLRAWDYGIVRHIVLRGVDVFDVNGSLVKNAGEGHGIYWENGGDRIRSRFDGLLIESCHLRRTDRNGICGRSRHQNRSNWFPSLNVLIRNNLLEDIGGDCIKPWGCDGAIIEYNRVRGGRQRCLDAAAGIWPWCSDNTLVQFNEVSGIKGVFDGQAFDTDGNCRNTIFQYNYSHDNDGGFMLMCNDGNWAEPNSWGTSDTIIRYNISQNDKTRLFHFAGPTYNTHIYNNVFWLGHEAEIHLFLWSDYSGWAEDVHFYNNIVYSQSVVKNSRGLRRENVEDPELFGRYLTELGSGQSRKHYFKANVFYGEFQGFPDTWLENRFDPMLVDPGSGSDGLDSLNGYRLRDDSPCIGAGIRILNNGERDLWGNPVPQQDRPSIGAHEPERA